MVNICIVHYNTPLLTECLIKSINKFTPDSKIYIFDNSDKYPFTYKQYNIIYFDNTKGEIINFDDKYSSYDFLGAVIHLFLSLPLSNNKVEKISMGYFTVVSPETYGETVIISACDYMYATIPTYYRELRKEAIAIVNFIDNMK